MNKSPTKLTPEQKARFAPMLHATWQAIGPDASPALSRGRSRQAELIEITCDANHPETYGGMSHTEYQELCSAYRHRDTQRWLREVLNY